MVVQPVSLSWLFYFAIFHFSSFFIVRQREVLSNISSGLLKEKFNLLFHLISFTITLILTSL